MKRIVFVLFIILGIIFRLWLTDIEPQFFGFDQWEYHEVTKSMITGRINTDFSTRRLYGYPLFLIAPYLLGGMEDTVFWKIFQAVLDVGTGVLIFLLADRILRVKKIAWIAYIMYIFNPYTSAYVGVRLTEILTIFLLTAALVLLLTLIKKREITYGLLGGLVLGFLPQVRPGFVYFDLFVIGIILFIIGKLVIRRLDKILSSGLLILLFSLPFSYTVISNYHNHKVLAFLTADNLFVREFYISLFIDSEDTIISYPPEVSQIYAEYSLNMTTKERKIMTDKYFKLALSKIAGDPKGFIASRIRKSLYVWEKHRLFPYVNRNIPSASPLIYWGNFILIIFSIVGIGIWIYKKVLGHAESVNWWFGVLTVLLVSYISILHAFTITAERFSLPAYPILFFFTPWGIWYSISNLKRVVYQHTKQ